ncbi:MAG TPA: CT583 family protein [Rhabdochlamydiaceae bacterium]|jgi:hypothetical protein
MVKVNSFLAERFKQATQKLSKMTSLVEMSSSGQLSSFTGVFRVGSLSEGEQEILQGLLNQYKNEEQEILEDLKHLSNITAEVKAINNQAIILHGERIKRAQTLLKNYQEGAFTAWLIAAYGNRQTPYNFLQYYELYCALPHSLQGKLDRMPKQAIYSLASRNASLEQKQLIIANYAGQPKQELLALIRDTFPLAEKDKRAHDAAEMSLTALRRLHRQFFSESLRATQRQKKLLLEILDDIKAAVQRA